MFLPGGTINLTINDNFKEQCSVDNLWVDYKSIITTLNVGDLVYVDDGLISLKIKEKKSDCFVCSILNGGLLGSKKVSVKYKVCWNLSNSDVHIYNY